MARTARSVVDVLLGEAVSGTPQQRYQDMLGIASVIANRAEVTGVSMQEVISAPDQFDAYGKRLPAGVDAFRELAEQAIQEVTTKGPVHNATFYATPAATKNLPSGLQPVGATAGHQYFSDPLERGIKTARGVIAPVAKAATNTARSIVDAMLGLPAKAAEALSPNTPAPTPAAPSAPSSPSTWDGSFSNPIGTIGVEGITSNFGGRASPMGIGSRNHQGMDMAARKAGGGYAAEAAAPGTVTFAGRSSGYGLMVEVAHPDGTRSRYGHLADINVAIGDEIASGTPVGIVGSSGRSTGPHLHFEVIDKNGTKIDPRTVTDMTNRSLSVTPSSRPMSPTEVGQLERAYGSLAQTMAANRPSSAPSISPDINSSRFGLGMPDPARFGGFAYQGVTGPLSPAGGYATAQAPSGMASTPKADRLSAPPSVDRFGPTADINPNRFGSPQNPSPLGGVFSPAGNYATAQAPSAQPSAGRFGGPVAASQPAAERFGRTPAETFGGPFSPAGSYATATGPTTAPSPTRPDNFSQPGQLVGSLGGLGGKKVSAPTPTSAPRATPAAMQTTQKQGRLGTKAAATPMAVTPTDFTAGPASFDLAGLPVSNVTTTPASFKDMPSLPAPANPMPNFSIVPNNITPAITPATIAPIATPTATRVAAKAAEAVRAANTRTPTYSAMDVHSGRAPAGAVATTTGGHQIARDQYGNTVLDNALGARTVTDPSGRQMGSFGGMGLGGLGQGLKDAAPGVIGGMIGNAIGGPVGGILGAMAANKAAGKTGGLGGLGGFFGGLFSGGSGNRGGGSSNGGRGSGNKSSGNRSAGSDRDHAGGR